MNKEQIIKVKPSMLNLENMFILTGEYFSLLASGILAISLYCLCKSYFLDDAYAQRQKIDYERVYMYVPVNSSCYLDSNYMKDNNIMFFFMTDEF